MVQVVMQVDTHVDTQGSEEVDRGKNEDSEELLGSSNDLNRGSGPLVEPRERKKGEVEKKKSLKLYQFVRNFISLSEIPERGRSERWRRR